MANLFKIAVVISVIFPGILFSGLPANLAKKVNKEIIKTFETDHFELRILEVPEDLDAQLPLTMRQNLWRIDSQSNIVGYAYIGSAPSKTAKFDFMVLFDKEARIINSKVLVYREDYGGEIGSRRWLRQFIGKGVHDRVSLESNIDAISGATISVRSMTYAMDNLLQSMAILKGKEIF